MYTFLNYFFFIFHTALTLFNILGWIFPLTRKWNLITLLITAGSWFVLGIWFGWGYCPCTDWHWDVREHLGYHDQQRSYIHFLLLKITGINFDEHAVEQVTLWGFVLSLSMSIFFNRKDYLHKRKMKQIQQKS